MTQNIVNFSIVLDGKILFQTTDENEANEFYLNQEFNLVEGNKIHLAKTFDNNCTIIKSNFTPGD